MGLQPIFGLSKGSPVRSLSCGYGRPSTQASHKRFSGDGADAGQNHISRDYGNSDVGGGGGGHKRRLTLGPREHHVENMWPTWFARLKQCRVTL